MKTKLFSALLFLVLIPSVVFAARPSITSLQQQINELQAQINQLESQVVTGNTPGDMQVWDGAAWVVLPATSPTANATLSSCQGVLTWGTCPHFSIGDTGPAGGIVFYVDDTGQHGLEAAPVDQGVAPWGCFGTELGADGTAIGTGAQNTADIINNCADTGIAARLAGAYVLNGYEDWFLPSKDELNELYINRAVVGGFALDYYWSSSEFDGYGAWIQDFGVGDQNVSVKDGTGRVRAVRAF